MRFFILTIISLIVIIVPGVLSVLILWGMIFPKHRGYILKQMTLCKGELKMAITASFQKIVGRKTDSDHKYVERVNLSEIHKDRQLMVDKAFDYLISRERERAKAYGPGLIVLAAMVGAVLVGSLWFISINFPLK